MAKPVIQVHDLGKRFRIGRLLKHTTLRETISAAVSAPFRRLALSAAEGAVPQAAVHEGGGTPEASSEGRFSTPEGSQPGSGVSTPEAVPRNGAHKSDDTLWALRHVSFDVQPGEVVGLIGRNGAGKSTLLKILARITRPTEGWAEVRGRVGSLLEVGTGFHQDLTGRENVFMSGAILGMRKAEIARKFDEIVAFAEVDRFIDTQLKHYSSGMQMRLAFAVAAHLEPEVLFVDEVLAVGDAAFQKKCLGKMSDVARHGRTILFVSHNMAAMRKLCSRAVLLNQGCVIANGAIADVVEQYLENVTCGTSVSDWMGSSDGPGNESIRLGYVRVAPPGGKSEITIDSGTVIEIGFENMLENINLDCTVYLSSRDGTVIFESGHIISGDGDSRRGFYRVAGRIPPHLLNAGQYVLDIVFGKDQCYPLFRLNDAVTFDIENTTTARGHNMSVAPGFIRPRLDWQHDFAEEVPLAGAAREHLVSVRGGGSA